jgi:MHS family proline/betaine transporter-like MFS transporter
MQDPPGPRSLTRVILAASAGNALEWYDFSVFGYFAAQIAGAFFPHSDPTTGLLLTFGTYGVSFLARPVGAAVLGSYADRAGRRAALTASILLMTLGTAMMAAMPGYATIGRLAPLGILAARLIQGFSAGGEFGGATAFMIEHAGRRPGFFGSFQFTSQAVSAILGSGVAWALAGVLSAGALAGWGFRVPFVLGLLIGPIGFYVRRHIDETPAFETARHVSAPLREVLRAHGGRVALAACVVAAGTAGTYLNIYLPTYAHRHLHMAQSSSFAVTFLASLAPLFVTPVVAHLSDRTGRTTLMIWLAGLLCVGAYPAFLLVAAYPTPMVLAAVLVGISVLRAGYTAPSAALLAEMFPVRVRAAGMSLGYTLGVVAFGGFAQLALEWLIDVTGNTSVPGLYMAATSLVTVTALLVIRRRVTLRL